MANRKREYLVLGFTVTDIAIANGINPFGLLLFGDSDSFGLSHHGQKLREKSTIWRLPLSSSHLSYTITTFAITMLPLSIIAL